MCNDLSPWSRLRGLEPMSLCDWPGRVCAVLFLGGCDLRCPTCHNFHLAWHSQDDPCLSRTGTLDMLARKASWLDGLVVTGGEATLSEDLPEWLAELHVRLSLPIKLDTNGMHPDVVERSLALQAVDLVAVDIKGPWRKYPLLTGNRISAHQAKATLRQTFKLAELSPDRFLFRTTLVPLLTPEDIQAMSMLLPSGFTLHTQPFRPFQGRYNKENAC
ncbi:MAG: anaerobic ribonucleoside-triphosphate reductase activating protein [Desulfovibrionales bacterium]|nr:MAG: anaerobic ribonucleoside-triphosphate reductase activating protein [Desulfovibrionales bacterium]